MNIARVACDTVTAERPKERRGAAAVNFEQTARVCHIIPEVDRRIARNRDAQTAVAGVVIHIAKYIRHATRKRDVALIRKASTANLERSATNDLPRSAIGQRLA